VTDIDLTATCKRCHQRIEHYAGDPTSEFMTPFWRHLDGSVQAVAHPAVPDPATVQEAH
jgi:hypothetical protein